MLRPRPNYIYPEVSYVTYLKYNQTMINRPKVPKFIPVEEKLKVEPEFLKLQSHSKKLWILLMLWKSPKPPMVRTRTPHKDREIHHASEVDEQGV